MYYYNTVTKTSVWEKPNELKTVAERALEACDWKEYIAKDSGRPYYFNKVTKATVWDMPMEYKEVVEKAAKQEDVVENATPVTTISMPTEFQTKEDAEQAFRKLLEASNVFHSDSWEDAIRKCCLDPMYKSLKTLPERKAAFDQWQLELKRSVADAENKQLEHDRVVLTRLLQSLFDDPSVQLTHVTPYKEIEALLEANADFQTVSKDNRRSVFKDFICALRLKQEELKQTTRSAGLAALKALLKQLDSVVTLKTTWAEFINDILPSQEAYQQNNSIQTLDKVDILDTFEAHMNSLDAEARQVRNAAIRIKRRQERIRRDQFKAVLTSLKQHDVIHAKAKWKNIYPLIKDEPSFVSMLGQPGSTPLDLFWDFITDCRSAYKVDARLLDEFIRKNPDAVLPDSTLEQFKEALGDNLVGRVTPINLSLLFIEYQADAQDRIEEEQRYQEKKLKRRMDAFKSLLKRVTPSIQVNETWNDIRSRLEGRTDYEALRDDNLRIQVFEKYVKRLKEKLDAASDGEYVFDDDEQEIIDVRDKRLDKKRSRSASSDAKLTKKVSSCLIYYYY